MYIDNHLNWNHDIVQLSKKLSRANKIFSKLRHNVPLEYCIKVYSALFHSHLSYGCSLWGLTTNESIKKIEILQKKSVRILTFSDADAHSNPLFIQLNIVKVIDLIKLNQLKLTYRFYASSLPTDLQSLSKFSCDVHTTNLCLNSARKNLLYIPRINSVSYGNKSLRYQCPAIWNKTVKHGIELGPVKIPLDKIHNVNHFSKILKKHFLHSYSLL